MTDPERRLRILYLPSWYPTVETPQYAIFLKVQAEALARDHDVVVLPVPTPLSFWSGPRSWRDRVEVDSGGAGIHTIWVAGPNHHPGWPDAEARTLQRLYRRGVKEAFRLFGGPPDLLHAQVAWAGGYYGTLFAREIGCPLVLTEHVSRPELLLGNPRDREWFHVAMRDADIVISVSPAQRKELNRVGIEREITVVPDLIDTDFFKPGIEPPPSPIRLITVGHLIERKGVEHLLHALAWLRREGRALALSIVGTGSLRARLEQVASELGIAAHVSFHGDCPQEEVRDLLRCSHVYVSASLRESFGVSVIEAMSVGLPVVVTRSGGPETFVTRDEGIVVDPGSPDELVRGLLEILDHRERFDAHRLHQSAEERFGIRSVTRRIHEQYLRALVRYGEAKQAS